MKTIISQEIVGRWFAKGLPKGQPRPRAFVRGKRAAVYDPGTAEGWKGQIALACRDLENRKLEGALAVSLTFYMPRPKSHFNSKGIIKPTAPVFLHMQKPDVDNLAKAVLDALTGIGAWHDDAQVCDLQISRYFCGGDVTEGCRIIIKGQWEEQES